MFIYIEKQNISYNVSLHEYEIQQGRFEFIENVYLLLNRKKPQPLISQGLRQITLYLVLLSKIIR